MNAHYATKAQFISINKPPKMELHDKRIEKWF